MKLDNISIENFKCFDSLNLETSKVTLLTGANSSGKSSILYSVLGAIQSGEFPFEFSPSGKYVNMGDFHDIVRNHDKDSTIKLGFTFVGNKSRTKIETFWIEDKNRRLPILKKLEVIGDYFKLSLKKVRKYHLDFEYDGKKDPIKNIFSGEMMKRILKILDEELSKINPSKKRTKSAKLKEKQLQFEERIAKYSSVTDRIQFSFSDISELQDKIREHGNFTLDRIYSDIRSIFKDFDNNLNFISSFRLYPEKTYYEKSQKQLKVGKFGEKFEDQIILWETNRAPQFKELTKIMRDLSLFEEIITQRIGGGRYEILIKNSKGGVISTLSDVGFGISQFLPIIVADLQLDNDSTLFIAQPEIHLHPKVQAQFGNYIVDRVNKTDKKYVLETHSEYLINRLRLAIVNGDLEENDVSVYYLDNDGEKVKKHTLKFTKKGQIKGAPKGFFETYMMDIMDIALQA